MNKETAINPMEKKKACIAGRNDDPHHPYCNVYRPVDRIE